MPRSITKFTYKEKLHSNVFMFADMPAELSSLYYTGNYVAGYGNDGVSSTHFHTKCRIGEWWRVDLQMKRCVKAIRITNIEENHSGFMSILCYC